VEPEVSPLPREAAALEMLRHTMNRQPGSALSRSYGEHPHLGVYADLFGALAAAHCYRLRPGTPEATAAAVLETLDGLNVRTQGRPGYEQPELSTAPERGAADDEERLACMRAIVS